MKELALLLTEDDASQQDRCVAKLLRFFNVPSRDFVAADFPPADGGDAISHQLRLLCSAEVFLQFIQDWERNPKRGEFWAEYAHSAFIFPGNGLDALRKLIRILTGDDQAVLCETNPGSREVIVSDQLDDFCGVMAGIRFAASEADADGIGALHTSNGNAPNIISLDHTATFLKLEYQGVPIFFSTSGIIDIDAEVKTGIFDIRNHVLAAVPIVLYLKWAFPKTCWNPGEINACLVVDDPLLKPTHGFLNFREFLSLMKRHNFSTNIAFIPWNWRRSTPEVVQLFRENPENYSISVHGCDHTRAEFGSPDRDRLYYKARQALDRMTQHELNTGIHHDRVMVFPQGKFSEAAMRVLKHSGLIAAVNNDSISADLRPRSITISELWDIAVMVYSNFPIFTRRYPWEGVENFAFDALLGKPAIIVIHHDYCSDHCSRLVNFIERLNALKCPLTWQSLGEVVRRSCRQRELSPGVVEVEMYGSELRIENRSGQWRRYLIRRRESDPSGIREIRAGSQQIAWTSAGGCIDFEIELNPGENRTVEIEFHDLDGNGQTADSLSYRARTMLRRYLCELRDNYITPAKFRLAGSC
jgi:hypothetical protein